MSKQFREFIMSAESKDLPSGYMFKILKRGRVIILPAPYNNGGQPNLTAMKLWGISEKERQRRELRVPMTKRQRYNLYRKLPKVLS